MFQAGGDTGLYIYQRGKTKADHTVASFEVEDVEAEVNELKAKGVLPITKILLRPKWSHNEPPLHSNAAKESK